MSDEAERLRQAIEAHEAAMRERFADTGGDPNDPDLALWAALRHGLATVESLKHPWFRRVTITATWDETNYDKDPPEPYRTRRIITHDEMCGVGRDLELHVADVVKMMTDDGVDEEFPRLWMSISVELYQDKEIWS